MNSIVKSNINSKLIINKIAEFLELEDLKSFILAHGTKVKCNIKHSEHIEKKEKIGEEDDGGVEYTYYKYYVYDCIEYQGKLYIKSHTTEEYRPLGYYLKVGLRLHCPCKKSDFIKELKDTDFI